MEPLRDIRILSLAGRLPGPVAVARLVQLGARAVKIEPPEGDPLYHACPAWYGQLHEGIEVITLNLKEASARTRLDDLLAASDLLLTAMRLASLERLGLSWPALHASYQNLAHIAIVGHAPPDEDRPGHDLTYQARYGLIDPPHLPHVLVADWGGAQAVVSTALSLLLARERGQGSQYGEVRLAEAARDFAEPLQHGLTGPHALLGGAFPGYNLYRARDGWIAVAALEPQFWRRLRQAVGEESPSRDRLAAFFQMRTTDEWEHWGRAQDLPIAAVRNRYLAEPDA
jgi:crotonobetainyl-CoA:carnitine CoA-transferase CaiB-like acyl-CoA transferase